jgi:hypothetical protein
MKYIYVISAFDTATWHQYMPAAFMTQEEARKYCKISEKVYPDIYYTWVRIPISKYRKN